MIKSKYPSTPYLNISGEKDHKDRVVDASIFYGEQVVITEKMDGENSSIYPDGSIHARSIDSNFHPSRSMLAAHAATYGWYLDDNLKAVVENCYAQHSIRYDNLPAVGYVISIMEDDKHLPWDDVVHWAGMLNLPTVPVLYRGILNPGTLESIIADIDVNVSEGFVVRLDGSFRGGDGMAKWVREGHVQTDTHWKTNWEPNGFRKA